MWVVAQDKVIWTDVLGQNLQGDPEKHPLPSISLCSFHQTLQSLFSPRQRMKSNSAILWTLCYAADQPSA